MGTVSSWTTYTFAPHKNQHFSHTTTHSNRSLLTHKTFSYPTKKQQIKHHWIKGNWDAKPNFLVHFHIMSLRFNTFIHLYVIYVISDFIKTANSWLVAGLFIVNVKHNCMLAKSEVMKSLMALRQLASSWPRRR